MMRACSIQCAVIGKGSFFCAARLFVRNFVNHQHPLAVQPLQVYNMSQALTSLSSGPYMAELYYYIIANSRMLESVFHKNSTAQLYDKNNRTPSSPS